MAYTSSRKPEPTYLFTAIGTIWVRCRKCSRPIPIWQAGDEGEETTGKKFTCPPCRGEGFDEKPLPIPQFTNVRS